MEAQILERILKEQLRRSNVGKADLEVVVHLICACVFAKKFESPFEKRLRFSHKSY